MRTSDKTNLPFLDHLPQRLDQPDQHPWGAASELRGWNAIGRQKTRYKAWTVCANPLAIES